MKSTRAAQGSVDVSNLSIPDAEEIIEEALNELAFSTDPGLARALHFLAPPGYQAIVELCSENGRSKRRSAAADAWSPDSLTPAAETVKRPPIDQRLRQDGSQLDGERSQRGPGGFAKGPFPFATSLGISPRVTWARRPDVRLTPGQVGRAREVDGQAYEGPHIPGAPRALVVTLPLLFSCSAAFRSRRRPQEPRYMVSCKWSWSYPGTSRPSSRADDGPFAEIRMETPRPRRARGLRPLHRE